jgi:uncharacterized membrane protein
MSLTRRLSPLPRKSVGSVLVSAQSSSVGQRLKVAGLFLFLLPLIVILGTIDFLTHGRSRNWP